jgi:hypothetical protein
VPIQGLVRLRKHQFGRQAVHGTKVAATYAYGLTGVPDNELNWTDPEVDAGSRVVTAAPYRNAPDLTASLDTPALEYNTLPIIHSGFFGGQVVPTGGGTAKTWAFDPQADTVEDPDEYTYEFGDDVLTDWFQNGDGILESFEISGPVGLGPLTASMQWRFGSISSTGSTDSPVTGTVPTPGLSVETDGAKVYLKDMGIYIADTVAGLGAGQVLDALHAFTLRGNIEWDQKRYANGTQNFDISGWGPGLLSIELECVFAKTADTVGVGSESDHWLSDESVNRYIQLTFESTVMAQTPSTPYSWDVIMPARYYTREEGEEGQNTTIILTAHAFYDPDDLDGFFQSTIVNTLTEAQLGLAGS